MPNFAAPLRKNSFGPGTSHTTASAAALHAFVAARYFAADAASLAADEAPTTAWAPAAENTPVAHDAASAIAAKPLNVVRIASRFRGDAFAKRRAPARYRNSAAARSIAARARSTAAAVADASPLA